MPAPSPTTLPTGLVPDSTLTRVRVLTGEDADIARRAGKTVVARSDCSYYCPDAATVARCIQALQDSDERLRRRPAELMLWDWQSTFFEPDPDNHAGGGTILLGVAWYDREFYAERHNSWLGALHKRAYAAIGVSLGDITVTHWLLDAAD